MANFRKNKILDALQIHDEGRVFCQSQQLINAFELNCCGYNLIRLPKSSYDITIPEVVINPYYFPEWLIHRYTLKRASPLLGLGMLPIDCQKLPGLRV